MRVFAGLVALTLAALVCGLFAPVAAHAAPTWTQGTAPALQAVPLIQAGDVTWTLSHNAFDPTGAVAIGRRAGTGAFVSDPGPGSANIQLGQWAMNAQGQGVITATSFDVGGTVVARREQGTWSNFTQLAGDEHPVSAAVDDAGNSTVVTMRNNSDVSQNVYAYTRDGTRSVVYAGAPDHSLSAEIDRGGRAILIIDRAGGDSVGPMVKVATVDGVGGWAVQTVATVLNTAMAHNIIDGHGIAVGVDGTIAATWSELHADFDVGSEYLTAIRVAVKAPGQDWDAQTVESATSVYEASGQSGPGVSRGRIGVAAATPIVAYSRYQVVGSNPQSGQVAVSEYRNGMWIAAPGVTASHGGTYCGGGDAVVAANDAGQAVVAGTRREGSCGVEESTYVVANTRGADGQWAVASLDRAQATAVWHADLDEDGHAVVEQQPGGAGPVDIYDAYLGGRTQITGGPSGLVAVGNPTFSWANTPEGASSRCRMDDGPWLACSSPQSYPGLGDGPHVFSVHSVVDDRSGVADTRAFALDTTAPQTTITSAPPASSENAFAEVRFTADDPNVTFVCALDGGAALPCTSPYQTLALAPGAHTLSVAATDALGNADASPATAGWTVTSGGGGGGGGGGGPVVAPPDGGVGESCTIGARSVRAACQRPPTSVPTGAQAEPKDCARGRVSRVEFGPIVAIARSQAACFEQVKGGFVSKGPVTLNGMILSFPDNGKITIEPTDNHLYSTSATMNVSGFQVPVGKYDMRPLGAQANRAVKVTTGRLDPPGSAAKVGGLTVNAVDYSLSKDDDGTAKLTWDISAPDAFSSPARQRTGKPRPEDALSFSWAISTSGADGPNFTGRATIARALFKGAIEVNNLVIGFDTRSGTWNGGLTVLMPGGSPSVSATVAMGPGGLRQLALAAQQINRPIGTTGIFLQKLGGEYNGLTAAPFLSLSGGVSAGPAIKVLGFNGQLIGVDGQLKISLTASPDVEISGTGSLANFKIADGSVKYATNTVLATFSGDVAATFPGGGLAWSVRDGTLNDPQLGFSLLGTGEARLWGLRKTVSVTAMKGGGMACWGTAPKRAGVSFGWGSNQLSHIGEGACDIGSLRKANLRRLRAGGGSGVQTVRLAAQPVAAFEVVGQGAAPQIALITPTGTSTEIRAAVDSKDLVAWRDETRNTLHVIVYDPAPGDWKLTPLAGSAPLASVASANALPQPKVTATLRGGQLRVALQPRPDQQVRLVEQGKFGQRTIATIERSKQLRVKPAAGVGGSRRIVAQVLQDGLLRDVKTLVRYTAKTSQVPSPRQLKITRRAGTATLAWRASAKEYVVVGALSGGRRPVWVTKRPALTIKGLRAGDTGTLQVIAVGADRRRSAPATIRLRASRATRAAR